MLYHIMKCLHSRGLIMEENKLNIIVDKIRQLTQEPLAYLQENSNWFSEKLVLNGHKDIYPYLNQKYEDFFFDKTIDKLNKEVALKFIVSEGLNDTDTDKELIAKWIIKIWGGIKGIKDPTINNIVNNLEKEEYAFRNISSWSKVHSFKNIDADVIYDSKVIYSLNWLLFQLNDAKFFLQPEGRNKRLTTFPMNAIINFKYNYKIDMNKKGSKVFEDIYLKENEVYRKYRALVSSLNEKLWDDATIDLTQIIGEKIYLKDYPFFTELLLFNMADDVVVNDIRENIFIGLKN